MLSLRPFQRRYPLAMITNGHLFIVHQSGELETLLENNGVIPKVEPIEGTTTEQTLPEMKDKTSA